MVCLSWARVYLVTFCSVDFYHNLEIIPIFSLKNSKINVFSAEIISHKIITITLYLFMRKSLEPFGNIVPAPRIESILICFHGQCAPNLSVYVVSHHNFLFSFSFSSKKSVGIAYSIRAAFRKSRWQLAETEDTNIGRTVKQIFMSPVSVRHHNTFWMQPI